MRQRFEGCEISLGEERIATDVWVAGALYAGCRHYEELINRALDAVRDQRYPETLNAATLNAV